MHLEISAPEERPADQYEQLGGAKANQVLKDTAADTVNFQMGPQEDSTKIGQHIQGQTSAPQTDII